MTPAAGAAEAAMALMARFCPPGSPAYAILARHGRQVADKALAIAAGLPGLTIDLAFLEQAALLHDIGILLTDSPALGCHGPHPYIRHGALGRSLIEARGMLRHALVCERHVGAGLTVAEIAAQGLPLPRRPMLPESIEEIIVCVADKFYSKNGRGGEAPRSCRAVAAEAARYGAASGQRMRHWLALLGLIPSNP
jgi:uncharacterized protein